MKGFATEMKKAQTYRRMWKYSFIVKDNHAYLPSVLTKCKRNNFVNIQNRVFTIISLDYGTVPYTAETELKSVN